MMLTCCQCIEPMQDRGQIFVCPECGIAIKVTPDEGSLPLARNANADRLASKLRSLVALDRPVPAPPPTDPGAGWDDLAPPMAEVPREAKHKRET
jgi:hypothetical protein